MEITPVYLQDENDQHVLTGAVVMLRSTIRMGRQLQMSPPRMSAPSVKLSLSARK